MATIPAGLAAALQDRYRLDRELGQGGMATVYLAHDLRHGREVALKVLRPELAAVLGRERFLSEIRLTARLDHPHILTLIDSGESEGFLWYVVPFIRGESLRDKIEREKQVGIDEALTIAKQVAGALDYAHRQGVIHRDVKPENILLYEGHATLADFGIALAVSEASGGRLTETGLSLGTPQYMSPEQATGERQLDARSDIYSLGVVLYEMLAGDPPFTGRTGQAVVAKLMTERPTPLRLLRDTLPPAVDDAVARALAKVPADRFTTAAAFAAALTDGPPTDRRPPSRRLSRPMAMLAPLIFLAAGAIGWRLVFGGHRRPARDPEVVALAQRALQGYNRRTPAGAIEAIRQYEDAVRRDSTYSTAWAGLAKTAVRCYMRYFEVPGIGPDSLLRLAVYAADRAVETDSANADAWLARAQVSRSVDPTDPEPPIRAVRRALALDSTLAEGWHFLALGQAESGDFADGMTNWRRTVRVGPTYAWGLAFLGLGHYWQRQYDSAAFWADSSLTFDPNYLLGRETMGYVAIERGQYARGVAAFDAARRLTGDVEEVNALAGAALGEARAGRKGEARSLVQRAESLAARYLPVPSHTAVYIAQVHAALGDRELALAWLTRFQPRGDLHFQLHLRCDPPFDPLHADPRFRALLVMPLPPPGKGC